MRTNIEHITIADLIAARDASLSPDCGSSAVRPAELPQLHYGQLWAGLVELDHNGHRILVDGHHRTSGLQAAVKDGFCGLSDLVPVVLTNDADLLDAVLAATDRGESVEATLLEHM